MRMPYSAHRPGRFDSQGRIILDSDPNADTDDLDFLREYEPTGADERTTETAPSSETDPQAATEPAREDREPHDAHADPDESDREGQR